MTGMTTVDLIIDGVNVADLPEVLLTVDYPPGDRVWTLTVNGEAHTLGGGLNLIAVWDVSEAFLAARFQLEALTWGDVAGVDGYTVTSWRRLGPGEVPQNESAAELLARTQGQQGGP